MVVLVSAVSFDPAPSRVALAVPAIAGVVAVAASAVVPVAALVAVVGAVTMPVAVHSRSQRVHALGGTTLFVGVLLAGLAGASPVRVLLGVGATVVAWDAGANGISVGAQLGQVASTWRVELTHVAGTVVVALLVGTLAYVAFDAVSTEQPTAALILVVAALVLAWLLDR